MQDLRIAMVQMNSRVAEQERNLATIARFTEQAAAQQADIICFPELSVCGYNAGDPSTPDPEPLKGASLRRLEEISLQLYEMGRKEAESKGIIIADTKFEFGLNDDGVICLADEILTPDSSRYWLAESYPERFEAGENPEGLDKEFLRLWVAERCDPYKDEIPEIPADTLVEFSQRYVRLYELVTGETFEADPGDTSVATRIRGNLAPYF